MIPGSQLHRLSRRLCGAALSDRVFEPLLADVQREWREAPPGVRRVLRLAKGYAAFWQAAAVSGLRAVATEAVRPPSYEIQVSTLGTLALSTMALILLQSALVGLDPTGAVGQASVVSWWIVFNTATAALPLALFPICWRARVKQARAADVVKIAIAGAALTVAMNTGVASWAERQHVAAVIAHQSRVDAATRARSHQDRYAWAALAHHDRVQQTLLTSIAGLAVLALAVAWMGWSMGRPRERRMSALARCWLVVLLLLVVRHESESGFQIWKSAVAFVLVTFAFRGRSRTSRRPDMLRPLLLALILGSSVVPGVLAQTTGAGYADALSPSLARVANAMHATIRRDLAEAANRVPAEEYGFRPSPDLRTFGQLVGHAINANQFFCSQAGGDKGSEAVNYEQVTSKGRC